MTVNMYISLLDFKFFGEAINTRLCLSGYDLFALEDFVMKSLMESKEKETITPTDINDFFIYRKEDIAKYLGFSSFDEMKNERRVKPVDQRRVNQ